MGTIFSGDTGYRGIVKLNDTILLATSGQFSINHDPIFSSGVWGAGYQNAAQKVAYANNYLRLEGSFGFELTAGEGLSSVNTFCFENRGNPKGTSIMILPNGQNGFQGIGWCSSLSFNASEGSVLTCDCNFQSYIDGVSNNVITGSSTNTALGASEGTLPFAPNSLYPYWATQVFTGTMGLDDEDINNQFTVLNDIVNWSVSYDSQIQQLKCCRQGKDASGTAYQDGDGAPLGPDYIMIGTMNASGNYTVFKLQGDFAPQKYHGGRSLKFVMAPSSEPNANDTYVYIPTALNNSGSTSIQTGAQYITAEFNFDAMGDGKNPPMSLKVPSTGGESAE